MNKRIKKPNYDMNLRLEDSSVFKVMIEKVFHEKDEEIKAFRHNLYNYEKKERETIERIREVESELRMLHFSLSEYKKEALRIKLEINQLEIQKINR